MRVIFFFIVGFSILEVSCDKKIDYLEYKKNTNELWDRNQELIFEFNVKDTSSKKNMFIQVRHNKDYPFSNLSLTTKLETPGGAIFIDTLVYEMVYDDGKWKGLGYTDIKEISLLYREGLEFLEKGYYKLTLAQVNFDMGKKHNCESLIGIRDIGFKIEKIN